MFVLKTIAEQVLQGTLVGDFILRNGIHFPSKDFQRNLCPILSNDYPYVNTQDGKTYTLSGSYIYGAKTDSFDIVGFKKI